MTRERASDYDSKKALILSRAAQCFADDGFDVTTMIGVAAACGASKSHVYHYFRSKEDLLFEIVHEHTRELLADLTQASAGAASGAVTDLGDDAAKARFVRFVEAFVSRAADSRSEHLVLTTSLKYLPPERQQQVRAMQTQIVQLLIGLLGEINPARMKPRQARGPYAFLMFGMLIWTFNWYDKAGKISPRELAAMLSDLLLNGFTSAPR